MHRAVLATLVLASLALPGCAAAAAPPPAAAEPPGITARATGTVVATPDTATVVLGVAARDGSATAALTAGSERAAAVIEVLTGAGVAPADLKTSELRIHPIYGQDGTRITGYEVTNLVTATLRDIAAAGAVIDRAAAAAGDAVRVQHVGFSIADDSEARARARADAVRRALAQAGQLAEAAGVELGAIRSIVEVHAEQPPSPYRAEAADARPSVPVEPGSQEVAVVVEVVHGLAG